MITVLITVQYLNNSRQQQIKYEQEVLQKCKFHIELIVINGYGCLINEILKGERTVETQYNVMKLK